MTSPNRKWAFRCAAILLGVLVVVVAEVSCRLLGWGLPAQTDDPFVGFESIVPLFVESDSSDEMKIADGRLRFFAADSFPATKAQNTVRIFVLGGSTVQGRPFSIETSFPTWLQQSLTAADSTKQWEVVNCGGVSYASYRLVPILEECLDYEPDLMIVCTGHNEFLEDRTYGDIKSPGSAQRLLGHSRLFTLMRSVAKPELSDEQKFQLSTDVEARLDYNDGLRYFNRDDAWHAQVVKHFGTNLQRMARACETRNVPVMFLSPPSNLADSPPFKTQPNEAVADQVRAAIAAARKTYRTDLNAAIVQLERAAQLDPRNAATQFELGRAYESAGRLTDAHRAFVVARDEDVCPLRMTTALQQQMKTVAGRNNVPLLDLHGFLEGQSKSSILGAGLLVDHIHPSFKANQLIAHELVQHIATLGFLQCEAGWEAVADAQHRAHFESLDRLYFLRGQRTLENLKQWARGRGHNLPERKEPEQ